MIEEFDTTDVVELIDDAQLYFVTGVIHDDGRLFVTGDDDKEFEVPFDKVVNRWVHQINKKRPSGQRR